MVISPSISSEHTTPTKDSKRFSYKPKLFIINYQNAEWIIKMTVFPTLQNLSICHLKFYTSVYWGRNKLADICTRNFRKHLRQRKFSINLTKLCPNVQLSEMQHCINVMLGTAKATSHYPNNVDQHLGRPMASLCIKIAMWYHLMSRWSYLWWI